MSQTQLMERTINYLDKVSVKQEALIEAMNYNRDQFQRILTNAVIKNPAIASCTEDSLYESVFESLNYGIVPDGRHGAIVPVRNRRAGTVEAQFWPMAWGLVSNARMAIPGLVLHNRVAYKGEHFLEVAGSVAPRIEHEINPEIERTDQNAFAFYAVAFLPKNTVSEFEVMYLPEILAMKKNNKGPWSTNFRAMALVRPLKRLLKRLPITGQFATQLSLDRHDTDGSLYEAMQGGQVINEDGSTVTADQVQPTNQRTRPAQATRQAQPAQNRQRPVEQAQPAARDPELERGTIEDDGGGEDLGGVEVGPEAQDHGQAAEQTVTQKARGDLF